MVNFNMAVHPTVVTLVLALLPVCIGEKSIYVYE